MSNQDGNSSAITPQQSTITSTTEEDTATNSKDSIVDSTVTKTSDEAKNESTGDDKIESTDNDNHVVRSESVIKSPSKPLFVSSSTPVIKVIDSSQESHSSESSEPKRSQAASVIAQTPGTQSNSQFSSTSFLHSTSNIAPTNPFLKTGSFSSSFISSSTFTEASDSNSESSIIFAPPKLIPSSFLNQNAFKTSFLRPSVLRVADSNHEDNAKQSETISTSNTFLSLNKEDIGKIKTPSFINSSINGNSLNKKDTVEKNDSDNSSKLGFLFGQRLEDRVLFDSTITEKNTDLKSEINSTSENLISFSDVTNSETTLKESSSGSIKSDDSKSENEGPSNSVSKNGDNSETVFKRKYEVITGEEDEQNVLSIHGKLYAWDSEKALWIEKGRGQLRLNDLMKDEKLCSRLVMRTSGALRVILNVHIIAGMKFEPANDNCLRFTYVDGIYLIKANPKDIDQLNSAIEYRLREISKRARTSDGDSENESALEAA